MTNTNNVGERINEFVLRTFPLARKRTLNPQDDLLESGIVDSLGILDLVAFIEQEFAIQVSDEDLLPENFNTVDRLTAFVLSRTPAARGPRE
jgi:acyl carrier protein